MDGKCVSAKAHAGQRMAPQVGLEPTTLRLTAECSAIELLRSMDNGRLRDKHGLLICHLQNNINLPG